MRPTYLAAEWMHELEDQPRFLYSELHVDRYEMRRVEAFRDGRVVQVEDEMELGDRSIPSMEEINAIPGGEFRAWEIGAAEFEDLRSAARPSG